MAIFGVRSPPCGGRPTSRVDCELRQVDEHAKDPDRQVPIQAFDGGCPTPEALFRAPHLGSVRGTSFALARMSICSVTHLPTPLKQAALCYSVTDWRMAIQNRVPRPCVAFMNQAVREPSHTSEEIASPRAMEPV